MPDEEHTLLYQDEQGVVVRLTVPWGFGSGRIPPPTIVFYDNGQHRTFGYARDEEREET